MRRRTKLGILASILIAGSAVTYAIFPGFDEELVKYRGIRSRLVCNNLLESGVLDSEEKRGEYNSMRNELDKLRERGFEERDDHNNTRMLGSIYSGLITLAATGISLTHLVLPNRKEEDELEDK